MNEFEKSLLQTFYNHYLSAGSRTYSLSYLDEDGDFIDDLEILKIKNALDSLVMDGYIKVEPINISLDHVMITQLGINALK